MSNIRLAPLSGTPFRLRSIAAGLVTAGALTIGCGSTGTGDGAPDQSTAVAASDAAEQHAGQRFPDVIAVTASRSQDGWAFDVTLSSPYDSPERYADAWRIVGAGGTVYGIRELTHDHASEQPFTRSLRSVEIPDDVTTVTVEGRDQQYGWGGGTFLVTLTG